jgi:hypothetical protein
VEGGGVGPRCSFCGTAGGPFLEVGGGLPLLMCASCQAARAASGTAGLLEPPAELLARRDPGEPWLEWGCPIEGCTYRVALPWWLEEHTAAEHPGWTATYELVRPLPRQVLRVVYRRTTGQDPGEGGGSPAS